MANKKFTSKVTGVHALTGIALEEGREYEIEEALAGAEIFEEIKTGQAEKPSARKKEAS